MRQDRPRPSFAFNRQPLTTGRYRSDVPNRSKTPKQHAAPVRPEPKVPTSRKQWKHMYKGAFKRLGGLVGQHARQLLALEDLSGLVARYADHPNQAEVRQTVNKILRLREMPFYGQTPNAA